MKEPFRGIGKMGKRVTSIKENKKKRTFEVSFGLEKLTLSEDTFTDYLLYVGKEISSSLFLRMKKESELEGIYEYALSLLSKGSYSSYEIEEKIKNMNDLDDKIRNTDRKKTKTRAIQLLAGSGVNEDNIREIFDATGIHEYHFSARVNVPSRMKHYNHEVYMGAKGVDEANSLVTSAERVKNMIEKLCRL